MAPRTLAAALLVALFCLAMYPGGTDAGYIYPSDCPSACSPATYYTDVFNQCVSTCNNCLLGYNCYSQFQPYFTTVSGVFQFTWACWCYWPWWAWFLLSIGILLFIGLCIGCALYISRRNS